MKKNITVLLIGLLLVVFTACSAKSADVTTAAETTALQNGQTTEAPTAEAKLTLNINGESTPVIWENNESVDALKELVKSSPLTIKAEKYGGFEQVGEIGKSLPENDVSITTQAGDIMLYTGDRLVLFYGSNTWEYTRLGRIDLPDEEISRLLSDKPVTVTIEYR